MITFSKLGQYGRFGNQLWQIASTIGIANNYNEGYIFPDWEYARYFKNQLPYGKPDGPIKAYNEKTTNYHTVELDTKYNWDLYGYFQSFKYFDDYKADIQYYFELNDVQQIDAVALHVRRGDYLLHKDVHPILGLDYYRKAISYFKDEHTIFVFSDDINWCRRYLKGDGFDNKNMIFDMATPTIISFMSMVGCKHNIIANSSFSWWGAYLNPNKDKIVVAPNIWTYTKDESIDDRLPENWIRIKV